MFVGWPWKKRAARLADARLFVPREEAVAAISRSEALRHPAVYRAVSIICSAMTQLPLRQEGGALSDIVRRPDPDISRDQWVELLTMSLITHGEAYVRVYRDSDGTPVVLRPVDPAKVGTPKPGRYSVNGVTMKRGDIIRSSLVRPLGADSGISPLDAAMASLTMATDLRRHISMWFRGSGQPSGFLYSDAAISAADAETAKMRWNQLDESGQPISTAYNPTGVRVLGKGFRYEPNALKPADALWLEQQAAVNEEIARVFGLPPALMMVSPGAGASLSYSNVSQEWVGFVRFGLMQYVRRLEGIVTEALPAGEKAVFDVEGLLRADTLTRYQSYSEALAGGWLTVDEVREIEGL